jgi:redox-regulated HSP33 family molecular chaperone
MRGDQHIEELVVDGAEEGRIKGVLNKALTEIQKKTAKKMRGDLSDWGVPGL